MGVSQLLLILLRAPYPYPTALAIRAYLKMGYLMDTALKCTRMETNIRGNSQKATKKEEVSINMLTALCTPESSRKGT